MKIAVSFVWLVALAWLPGCFRAEKPDGSGTIECTQAQVSPRVGGCVLRLIPQEGDFVRKGDLLAQIDPADYELRRNEARAAQAQAQAQLDLVLAGNRQEDILKAKAQVQDAQAAARAADADLKRIEQVFEQKSATQKQMDDAKANADRTVAGLAAAQQNLAKLVKGSREEEVRVAQAQVELARARVVLADKGVADCSVTAPMDGTVTTRSREEGEVVSAGSPLLSLSRLDPIWLSIYIPEDRLGRVKLGQPAWVRIDGEKEAFQGTVTFLASEAEFTPKNVQTPDERTKLVYRLKITLANPERVFKPGMPADGYLTRP